MKPIIALVLASLIFASCESTGGMEVQKYREDGLPVWVEETFSNPRGHWAGYNEEKGYYASGKALYGDGAASTKAAELDAKTRLSSYLAELDKAHRKPKNLIGVQRMDRLIAEDGTVYVLLFISQKDAKRSF